MRGRFHHLHFYVDEIAPTQHYKQIEAKLNELANKGSYDPFSGGMRYLEPGALPARVQEGREAWMAIAGDDVKDPAAHTGHGQDMVEQLIVGLGWRITAEYNGTATRTVLCTSSDALGVKVALTCLSRPDQASPEAGILSPSRGTRATCVTDEMYEHFNSQHLKRCCCDSLDGCN